MDPNATSILFFDGDCGLCNRAVRVLAQHDTSHLLYYAPLQGATAAQFLPQELCQTLSTAVYHRRNDSRLYLKSDAVLCALIDINSHWRLVAKITLSLPLSLRNAGYDLIAKHRHLLVGQDRCELHNEKMRARILE